MAFFVYVLFNPCSPVYNVCGGYMVQHDDLCEVQSRRSNPSMLSISFFLRFLVAIVPVAAMYLQGWIEGCVCACVCPRARPFVGTMVQVRARGGSRDHHSFTTYTHTHTHTHTYTRTPRCYSHAAVSHVSALNASPRQAGRSASSRRSGSGPASRRIRGTQSRRRRSCHRSHGRPRGGCCTRRPPRPATPGWRPASLAARSP